MISITLQNAALRRTVQMMDCLLTVHGQLVSFDGRELWSFWEPKVLSRVRGPSLRDLRGGLPRGNADARFRYVHTWGDTHCGVPSTGQSGTEGGPLVPLWRWPSIGWDTHV